MTIQAVPSYRPVQIRLSIGLVSRRHIPALTGCVITHRSLIQVTVVKKGVTSSHAARADEKIQNELLLTPTHFQPLAGGHNLVFCIRRRVIKAACEFIPRIYFSAGTAHRSVHEPLHNVLVTIHTGDERKQKQCRWRLWILTRLTHENCKRLTISLRRTQDEFHSG